MGSERNCATCAYCSFLGFCSVEQKYVILPGKPCESWLSDGPKVSNETRSKRNERAMTDDSTGNLLRIMRVSGVFKCTECMHCKPEATAYGNVYKCVRDGAALNGYRKTRREVMQGAACCNFYPRPMAGEAVALRQSAIMTGTRALIDLAEESTEDEKRLARTCDTLYDLGV